MAKFPGAYSKAYRRKKQRAFAKAIASTKKHKGQRKITKAACRYTPAGPMVTVPNLGGIIPKFRTKLAYDVTYGQEMDSSVVTSWSNTFRCNSLYDFDYTNGMGNFQCAGRDRLADMYSLYIVRGVQLHIDIVNAEVGGDPNQDRHLPALRATWYQWIDEGSGTPSAPTYMTMFPGANTWIIPLNTCKTLTKYISTSKISGLDGTAFNAGTGSNTGSNPGKPLWGILEVTAIGVTGTTQFSNLVVRLRATFDIEYSQPRYQLIDTN